MEIQVFSFHSSLSIPVPVSGMTVYRARSGLESSTWRGLPRNFRGFSFHDRAVSSGLMDAWFACNTKNGIIYYFFQLFSFVFEKYYLKKKKEKNWLILFLQI